MEIYGVFIGIDKYNDPRIKRLKYAKKDAEVLFNEFVSHFPEFTNNFYLLLNEKATKDQIYNIIGEQIPLFVKKNDIVIIYFASHGSPESYKSNDDVSRYIITSSSNYDYIFSTSINMEVDLIKLIERFNAKLTFTILDTCFSGKSGGRTFMGSFLKHHLSSWRHSYSLKKLELGSGKIIFGACEEYEVAKEDDNLKHGIFTYFLLKNLKDISIDQDKIGIGTLYDKVFSDVYNYSKGKQRPVITGKIAGAGLPIL